MRHSVLDVVVLARDLPSKGLKRGDLGTIVEIHDRDEVEVEFTTASGHAQAILTLKERDLRAVGDNDIPTVRPHHSA